MTVVATHYTVDLNEPLPHGGGGLQAFAAMDIRGTSPPLMGVLVKRDAPVRARALQVLTTAIPNLCTPVAHGVGQNGSPGGGEEAAAYYVICQAPFGPPVSEAMRPWQDTALIEFVLRPLAAILEELQSRGLTHRAIRPNNVFFAGANRPVQLGAAFAAPPAMHQPAVFETPYSALCHPAGRGEGRIADDIYSLGVLLLTLAIGRIPMGGLDDLSIAHRKLDLGDFQALTAGEHVPPMLTDILRGMLAEDPDHRPVPSLLRDPASARGRRVAARPPPRAQRFFKLGPLPVWNHRTLALAMITDISGTVTAMQSGTITYWLRRILGDANLAVKLEELVRQHGQDMPRDQEGASAVMVMRAIAAADMLMPLCWRGLTLFPDGLGPVLAGADPDLSAKVREIVLTEAQGVWAGMKEERTSAASQRLDARQRRAVLQIKGAAGGLARLSYVLNPLLPCASPLLANRWIVQLGDLPAALDANAAAAPDAAVLDPDIVAFIAARSERWLDQEVKAMTDESSETVHLVAMLRLLSELQTRFHPAPLPGLAAWLAARATPLIERWQNRDHRAQVSARLAELTAAGLLPPIASLLHDPSGQELDARELRVAQAELARLDEALTVITGDGPRRAVIAAHIGQEIAAGLGVGAVAVAMVLAAIG